MADRDKAGRNQTDAALCARKEVLLHLGVGASRLFAHVDIAHRRHDKAILESDGIHADRGEHVVVRIQLARKTRRAARAVIVIRGADPVAVAIDQLLNKGVLFQLDFPRFRYDNL
ncbi:hypothetical protein SDC9_91792 [bioreactor metagenome]|uniref:Uncharacterized protein n=1 Tax=bioreactor metagenome TaxID=1076179 RepID=A0A644ZWI5_9ZZZZ